MSIAFAPPRPAQHSLWAERCSSTKGPALLVIGDRALYRLATCLIASHSNARTFHCAPDDAVGMVNAVAVDLVLLNADASLAGSFVLAAHIRAAGRRRDLRRWTAIVAVSSSHCTLQDCLVGGSAIDGAMKLPCDCQQVAACIETWCPPDFRGPGSPGPRIVQSL